MISQYPFSPGSAASTAADTLIALSGIEAKASSSQALVRKTEARTISGAQIQRVPIVNSQFHERPRAVHPVQHHPDHGHGG